MSTEHINPHTEAIKVNEGGSATKRLAKTGVILFVIACVLGIVSNMEWAKIFQISQTGQSINSGGSEDLKQADLEMMLASQGTLAPIRVTNTVPVNNDGVQVGVEFELRETLELGRTDYVVPVGGEPLLRNSFTTVCYADGQMLLNFNGCPGS